MIIQSKTQKDFVVVNDAETQFENSSQNQTTYAISVVVPTRNEAGNIGPLLTRIEQATKGTSVEVIFVDDSTDNTPEVIKEHQNKYALGVVLIARPPERRSNGLGGAVVEGFQAARAPWVCVMDGDLQHPPEMILQLYKHATEKGFDVVIGSRLAPGGDASSLGGKRSMVSHTFATATRVTFPRRLYKVTDPLSGFFMTRRAAIDLDHLRPDGFKILLEILVKCPKLSISELPIHFGHRNAGESKASIKEVIRFIRVLLLLRWQNDQHFFEFVTVGVTGLLVNSLLLALATEKLGIYYLASIVIATVGSTIWNFALTEFWVYRDRPQRQGRFGRFSMFFIMNSAALFLRSPIVYVMTSVFNIHYLISNLVSLGVLTVLRYMFADKWIWGGKKQDLGTAQNYNDNLQTNLLDY